MTLHATAQRPATERTAHAKDFIKLARHLMSAKGDKLVARAWVENEPGASTHLRNVLQKADPGSLGGTSPITWGSELADYKLIAGAFLASLRHIGVFDRMLADMPRVPFRTAFAVSSLSIIGDAVGEGESKPVHELDLTAEEMDVLKSVGVVVVSAELLRLIPIVEGMIDGELRAAVVAGTDKQFVGGLIAATTPTASSGDVLFDLQTLLAAIDSGAGSKFFFVVDADAAKQLATTPSAVGGVQFPGMGPNGGQIIPGVEVLVSDQLSGEAILVDASQVAAASEGINLDVVRHANVQMGESPGTTVNLWQKNLRGIRCERWFAYRVLRSGAVASLSGVAYEQGSPA